MRRFLPLVPGIAVVAVPTLLLLLNLGVMAAGHRPIKLVPALTGVTMPEVVPVSLAAVFRGQTQPALARLVGRLMPLRPAAVRLRNQLEYSLFGTSPDPVVMVGRGGSLIERSYADEYCSRDLARWRPGARAWATRIRQMQDWEARRGRAFLYVLTPSKVAQYPDLLPRGFNCPAPRADRLDLLPEWTAMLRAAGVHVADTAAALRAAHGAYPFHLFPPGGTHWNAVGAAIVQRTVLDRLAHLAPGRGFAAVPFTWHMIPHPVRSDDTDLARLLNLFVPAARGPVPAATPHPAAPPKPCGPPPRVVIVGGSFSHATLEALHGMACPVAATEYEYWHAYTLWWQGDRLGGHPGVDGAARNADLLAADVLIYEENEELLEQPSHGQALWSFLRSNQEGQGAALDPLKAEP